MTTTATATNPQAFLQGLDRKVEVTDLTDDLRDFAQVWLSAYTGNFDFVLSVRSKLLQYGGGLSDGQAKGILNCARADLQRAPRAPPVALEDGIYLDGEKVYKVQTSRESGNQYAKLLTLAGTDETGARFEYARGAIRNLTPEHRMTLKQARELGARYGVCVNCGATLTDPESIAAGIGPVCATHFA